MSSGWIFQTSLRPVLAGSSILLLLVPSGITLPGRLSWLPSGSGQKVRAAEATFQPKARGQEKAGAAANPSAIGIPPVLLSAGHRKLCRLHVGDHLPPIELPRLGGNVTDLASLQGKQATIVLFWHPDRWMARGALHDFSVLARQWAGQPVALVGIASSQPVEAVQAQLTALQANFPQLLDTDGSAFSLVSASIGTTSLPSVYVLDAEGKIVWFDIEYSEATRRELRQTIGILQKDP